MRCKVETPLNFCESKKYCDPEYATEKMKREGDLGNALDFMFQHFTAKFNKERTGNIIATYAKVENSTSCCSRYHSANEHGISTKFWERIQASIKQIKNGYNGKKQNQLLFTCLV